MSFYFLLNWSPLIAILFHYLPQFCFGLINATSLANFSIINIDIATPQSYLITNKTKWRVLSQINSDSDRQPLLDNYLHKVVGVYNNKKLAKRYNLEKTVWINVLESKEGSDNMRYKLMLKNFLCHIKRYNLKSILYLLNNNITSYKNESQTLYKLFGSNLQIMPYPHQLFWDVIANKSKIIRTGHRAASYSGNIPSFKNFGSIVMLIPILEVLLQGYNVVYFDIDNGLLENPLPYLSQGDADLILSQELRGCKFPSFIPQDIDWNSLEPNTGIMYIKSNNITIEFFNLWLQEIVDMNDMNDQKAFSINFGKNPIKTDSCNHRNTHGRINNNNNNITNTIQTNQLKYCFLNEFVFQNGKMDFFCRKGKEDSTTNSSILAYLFGMYKYNKLRHIIHKNNHNNSTNHHYNNRYNPISLHVNYCDDKIKKLLFRGLWIYNESLNVCDAFNFSRTSFHKYNWNELVKNAKKDYNNEISKINNATVLSFPQFELVYYVYINNVLRKLKSKSHVQYYNYSLSDIKQMSTTLYLLTPRGSDLV